METKITEKLRQLHKIVSGKDVEIEDYNHILLPMYIDNLLNPTEEDLPKGSNNQLEVFTINGESVEGFMPNEVHFTLGFAARRTNIGANTGKYCYQAILLTSGLMQIGIFEDSSKFDRTRGVGDFADSYAYDGYRQCTWNKGDKSFGKKWKKGDVITICCDFDNRQMKVFQNDEDLGVAFDLRKPRNSYFFGMSASAGEKCILNFGDFPMLYSEMFEEYQPVMPQPLQCYRNQCEILTKCIKECMNEVNNVNLILLQPLLFRFIPLITTSKVLCIEYFMKLLIDLKEKNQLKRFIMLIRNLVNVKSLDVIIQTLMQYYYIISTHFTFNISDDSEFKTETIIDIMCDLIGLARKDPQRMFRFVELIMSNFTVLTMEDYMKMTEHIDLTSEAPDSLMIVLDAQHKAELEIDKKLLRSLEENDLLNDFLDYYSGAHMDANNDLQTNANELTMRICFALFHNIIEKSKTFRFCNDFLKDTPTIFDDYDRLGGTISYIQKTFPISQNREYYELNKQMHQAVLFFNNNASIYFNRIELVCRKNLGLSSSIENKTEWLKYLWNFASFILPTRYDIQMQIFSMLVDACMNTEALLYVHETYISVLNTLNKNLRSTILFKYQKEMFGRNMENIGKFMNLYVSFLDNKAIVKPELRTQIFITVCNVFTKRFETMKLITPENQIKLYEFAFDAIKTEEEERYRKAITIIRLGLPIPFFVINGNRASFFTLNNMLKEALMNCLNTVEKQKEMHLVVYDFINRNLDQLLLMLDKERLTQHEEKMFKIHSSNLLDGTDLLSSLSYHFGHIYQDHALSNKFLQYISFILYQCGVRKTTTRQKQNIYNLLSSLRLFTMNMLHQIIITIPEDQRMKWLMQDGILTTSLEQSISGMDLRERKIFSYDIEYPTATIDRWFHDGDPQTFDLFMTKQNVECLEALKSSVQLLHELIEELNKKVTKKVVIKPNINGKESKTEFVIEEEEDEDKLCFICWSNPADTIMLPCKHSACSNCIRKNMEKHDVCFFCTAKIEELKDRTEMGMDGEQATTN